MRSFSLSVSTSHFLPGTRALVPSVLGRGAGGGRSPLPPLGLVGTPTNPPSNGASWGHLAFPWYQCIFLSLNNERSQSDQGQKQGC